MKSARDEKGLIKALSNKDFKVRWQALLALRSIHDPRQYELVLTNLLNEDWMKSVDILALEISHNRDRRIRQDAVVILGRIDNPKTLEPILIGLKDEDDGIRKFAALVLGGWPGETPKTREPRAVDALIQALGDSSTDVRSASAVILGRIGDARALHALLENLRFALEMHRKDSYDNSYEGAVEGIAGIKDAAAASALIEILRNAGPRERQIVRGGLVKLGDVSIAPLLALLRDSNPENRADAATLLAKVGVGNDGVVNALTEALTDEDAYKNLFGEFKVSTQAEDALKRVQV